MWLYSGAPEVAENDTVMEMGGAEALDSAVKSWMHAPRTADEKVQQNGAHRVSQIAKCCMIRRWSESKLANGYPLIRIPMEKSHLP